MFHQLFKLIMSTAKFKIMENYPHTFFLEINSKIEVQSVSWVEHPVEGVGINPSSSLACLSCLRAPAHKLKQEQSVMPGPRWSLHPTSGVWKEKEHLLWGWTCLELSSSVGKGRRSPKLHPGPVSRPQSPTTYKAFPSDSHKHLQLKFSQKLNSSFSPANLFPFWNSLSSKGTTFQ